ncbi:MAG TPA: O-antigen ligase family protein [Anaerolineales bacterium]|jgi:O-antigen ligase
MTEKPSRKMPKIVDVVLLAVLVYWANLRSYNWYYAYTAYSGSVKMQLVVVVFLGLFLLWRLRWENGEREYLRAWRENWPVAAFVLLALASLSWSVVRSSTFYHASLALFVSLLAAYYGMRFSSRNLVNFVAISVGVFALASLIMAIFLPQYGIDSEPPYVGLWVGIFWHKNYLGAAMTLGFPAYLVIVFSRREVYSIKNKYLAGVMLAVCVLLAFLSGSASALIVFFIQVVLFTLVLLWLRWGLRLSRRVYSWLGGGALLVAALVLSNLGLVFGLFNRSANMTGRTPMWQHLLDVYIAKRPLFGYGFGAFWMQEGIMEKVRAAVGWGYVVRIADNGYLDILLGLGVVGLGLLLAMLAVGTCRSLSHALAVRDLTAFFPFFLLVHILFINISLSYFFETEIFIWFLLVMTLFVLRPKAGVTNPITA